MPMPKDEAVCQSCQSNNLYGVQAKCSDLYTGYYKGHYKQGYVPYDLNIGGGDYVEFILCLDCGQIQAKFPLKKMKLTKDWKQF